VPATAEQTLGARRHTMAKAPAAIGELARGRLHLGLGAGSNEMKLRMFSTPFSPLRERING